MNNKDLMFTYIEGIPFDNEEIREQFRGLFKDECHEKLEVKGKAKVQLFMPLRKGEIVCIYRSGRRKYIPLFTSASRWTNKLILRLNKKALSYIKNIVNLVESHPVPFKSKYTALLAAWFYQSDFPLQIHKDEFRAILEIPSSYQEANINTRILNPSIAELRELLPGLSYRKEGKEYIFEMKNELDKSDWIKSKEIKVKEGGSFPPVSQILAALQGEPMEGIPQDQIDNVHQKLKNKGLKPTESLAQEALAWLKDHPLISSWIGLISVFLDTHS